MEWQCKHFRNFQIAGITVRVESDMDLNSIRFTPELMAFSVESPGDDQVTLRHYFEWPDLKGLDLGKELYHKVPWSVSRQNDTWYYRTLPLDRSGGEWRRFAIFNADHTQGTIYSPPNQVEDMRVYGCKSLSLLPTDQIWLVPILADRNAVLLHSSAVILNGQGLLFVGHSQAGKSTVAELLKAAVRAGEHDCAHLQVEVLCDDRNVVRNWNPSSAFIPSTAGQAEWRVHGTWSHGTLADVSPNSASLHAILFLQQGIHNEIVRLTDRKEIWKRLLATLIRSKVTAEWWQKELNILEQIVNEVPCYIMHFDKSGLIVDQLVGL